MILVLDTSVAVKWFFTDEPGHKAAMMHLNRLAENSDKYIVPIIFHIEFTAVITRKSNWNKTFIAEALATLFSLGINTVAVGEQLSMSAIKTACSYKLSFHDSIYFSLAKSISGKWLTADKSAIKKCSNRYVLSL